MRYDVVIIGAGPAGLFAAKELTNSKLTTCIIDMGKDILERNGTNSSPYDIFCGVGGAGACSDGKLNLTPYIGMELDELSLNETQANRLIKMIDDTFVEHGASQKLYGTNLERIKFWKQKATTVGVELIPAVQRHMGSDNTPKIINSFKTSLEKNNVKFILNRKVESIEHKTNFLLKTNNQLIECTYLIVCPGRAGAYWFREQASKMDVKTSYGPIDVGLRVEVHSEVYEEITKDIYDPKFKMRTKKYDDYVRTFCTNPNGFVTIESNGEIILVNGHAKKNEKSENTNFALLSRIKLTEPLEDTTKYGRSIAKQANTIGGGKPIIQRLGDLTEGRRSTDNRIKRSSVTPTLNGCTPGDISMAMPHRIVMNMIQGLETLDKIVPGVALDSTLLYAPEIKFYDTKYVTNGGLETNIPNLFVAGDGVGKSRGIVGAAVSGILAAKGVKEKI